MYLFCKPKYLYSKDCLKANLKLFWNRKHFELFNSDDLIADAAIKTSFGICNMIILRLKASVFVAESQATSVLRIAWKLKLNFFGIKIILKCSVPMI